MVLKPFSKSHLDRLTKVATEIVSASDSSISPTDVNIPSDRVLAIVPSRREFERMRSRRSPFYLVVHVTSKPPRSSGIVSLEEAAARHAISQMQGALGSLTPQVGGGSRRCPSCGRQPIPSEYNYCPYCGARLS